jgi:hypothetical protein
MSYAGINSEICPKATRKRVLGSESRFGPYFPTDRPWVAKYHRNSCNTGIIAENQPILKKGGRIGQNIINII